MRLRGKLKQIAYGRRPFYRGTFPYFDHDVHFPFRSHLFDRACAEGIYEQEILELISCFIGQAGTYIDIGANIGLMSIPVLMRRPDVHVISVEASPETLRLLEKTRDASPHRARWAVFGCAVGRSIGIATYWAAQPENSAFDGIKDTGRGGAKQSVTVKMRTVDDLWQEAGRPVVSIAKIDVEGGEVDVIAGARTLIERDRPALVIEWNRQNLQAYGVEHGKILEVCREIGYRLFAYPGLFEVSEEAILRVAMMQTETFLLVSALPSVSSRE